MSNEQFEILSDDFEIEKEEFEESVKIGKLSSEIQLLKEMFTDDYEEYESFTSV